MRFQELYTVLLVGLLTFGAPAFAAEEPVVPLSTTVFKLPLAAEVSMDEAVESMKLRANMLNFKLVAHQPLSQELAALGIESGRIEIFQFCDARVAHEMLQHDLDLAAYLPCRIVLIEDADGKAWLVTLDLDRAIAGANLTPELRARALRIRDTMHAIMTAGANGEL